MATGIVYRAPARDAHGDPIDTDGNIVRMFGESWAKIGAISGLIVGGSSGTSKTGSYPVPSLRGEVVSTEGLIGWPRNSRIALQADDIVQIDGQRFKVSGPVLFGRRHSLSGRPLRYSWISVTGN
jgi:hypothetical protein